MLHLEDKSEFGNSLENMNIECRMYSRATSILDKNNRLSEDKSNKGTEVVVLLEE